MQDKMPIPDMLCVTIPGPPVPKQRPRFSKTDRRVYTPKPTQEYETHVGWCTTAAMAQSGEWHHPIPEPRQVYVDFNICNARGYRSAPDPDNVVKSVLDGLESVLVVNDRQVLPRVQQVSYSDTRPRVELRVQTI